MKEITSHKINGLNESLKVVALDEPGHGGAHHKYVISTPSKPLRQELANPQVHCEIDFQNGPVGEFGPNGLSNESLLAVVLDRLECFQSSEYACHENAMAKQCVETAIQWLHYRTKQRVARGVEGTHKK